MAWHGIHLGGFLCARFEKEITPSVYFYRDRNKPFSFLRHSRVVKRFDECEMLAPLNPYPHSNPGSGFDEVAAQTQYTWQASQDEKKNEKKNLPQPLPIFLGQP